MIEFRPGASSEAEEIAKQEAIKKEKELSESKRILNQLDDMINSRNSNTYSETFNIGADGKFEYSRPDGTGRYLEVVSTPEDIYNIAKEIEAISSEHHFKFEVDPEGKWFKYTVDRD